MVTSFMKYSLATIALVVSFGVGSAISQTSSTQTETFIKLSGLYVWGEGVSMDQDIANTYARRELISRIMTEYSQVKLLVGDLERTDEYGLVFKPRENLQNTLLYQSECTIKTRRDNSWLTLCHIIKDEYFGKLDQSIRDFKSRHVESNKALRDDGLSKAISLTAENWLESRYLPVDAFVSHENTLIHYNDYLKSVVAEWSKLIKVDVVDQEFTDGTLVNLQQITHNLSIYIDGIPGDGVAIVNPAEPSTSTSVTYGKASLDASNSTCQHQMDCLIYIRPSIPDYKDLRQEDIKMVSAALQIGRTDVVVNEPAAEYKPAEESENVTVEYEIEIRSSNPLASNILQELMEIENSDILKKWLDSQVRVNNIAYFTSDSQINDEALLDSFVILVNPQSKMIHSILSQETAGERTVFGSGERVKNLSETFKNLGVGPIWLQIKSNY